MSFPLQTRRRFLASAGLAGAGALVSPFALMKARGLRAAAAAGSEPILRKDVRDLSDSEICRYREAVRINKARGPDRPQFVGNDPIATPPDINAQTDKTGYAYQALLHTVYCPHRNWWFLPWHRVYLYLFEQVLREAAKDVMPDVPLAIPYWDWTQQRDVPEMFRGLFGEPNALADDRRFFSAALGDDEVGQDRIRQTLCDVREFADFGSKAGCALRDRPGSSAFEQGPHGYVHVAVGGFDSLGRFGTMTITNTSGFDPIFWSHHANIDRLWDVWLAQSGHQNPDEGQTVQCGESEMTWHQLKFEGFVDGQGDPDERTVKEFLQDPGINSVRYEEYSGGGTGCAVPLTPQAARIASVRAAEPATLALRGEFAEEAPRDLRLDQPVSLKIDVAEAARPEIRAGVAADAAPRSMALEVGVKPPANSPPVIVRVFLNRPDADRDTSVRDPQYVGYFTFFGTGVGHGSDGHDDDGRDELRVRFSIRSVLARLERTRRLDLTQPFDVRLVVVPMRGIEENAVSIPKGLAIPVRSAEIMIGR